MANHRISSVPEQERRHGVEDERHAGDDVVLGLVAPHDLVDAERDGDDDGEQRRDADEDERLRAAPGDERVDGLVAGVGAAQVEVRQVPQVVDELVPQRQVEPVLPC